MVKRLAAVVVGIVALMALAPFAIAAPTQGGTATGSDVLAQVRLGSSLVKVGYDQVTSTRTTVHRAFGEMTVGQSGSTTVPGASRTATSKSQNGTSTMGTGTKTIAGLLGVTIASGGVTSEVLPDHVLSAAQMSLGSIGLLAGLATIQNASIATTTRVDAKKASVTRTISIGRIGLLSIGDLLNRIGADPLALACSAVSSTGSALGVDTSAACSELAIAQSAIAEVSSALDTAKSALQAAVSGFTLSGVQADQSVVQAMNCDTLDLVCQASNLATLISMNTSGAYGIDLSALGFTDARDAMLAKFQSLIGSFQDIASLDGGIGQAASGTCSAVTGAVSSVASSVPSLASTITPLGSAVQNACDTLVGTLNALLDMPLLSVGGGTITLEVVAQAKSPVAKVSGGVGTLKIGNVTIGAVRVSANQADVLASARETLGSVLSSLGIGLPLPTVDLMKSTTSKGRRSDGTWFASASLSALHIGIPSVSLTLPTTNPLGVLAGTSGFGSSRPARSVVRGAAAPATTPAVDVDAGRFSGQSSFVPLGASPSGSTPSGEILPVTGVNDSAAHVLMALTIFGIALLSGRALIRKD